MGGITGLTKVEMSCYKCSKTYYVEYPSTYHPGYVYCPVCRYPMVLILPEDREQMIYEMFKKNIEEA
jgi:hypothetical protein